MFTYSDVIPDTRVEQAATFLKQQPKASLTQLAKHLEVGSTMCATLYRRAALKYLKDRRENSTIRLVKRTMRASAPPCSTHH